MRRVTSLLLLALLLPATAAANPERNESVTLTGARVVASPGTPEGLHPSLPEGRAPEPLSWPLPEGPVLVLGLPEEDSLAGDLARLWCLLPPGDDLHGGYVVAAWHDGHRPIAVILAEDAAALMAARFEWERHAPPDPGLRTPAVQAAPEETALTLATGRRHVRPRYQIRALDPRGPLDEAVLTAIRERANRIWLDLDAHSEKAIRDALPRLRRHGVVGVLAATARLSESPRDLAQRWASAREEHGIDHFAVRIASTHVPGNPYEGQFVRALLEGLKAGGRIEELVVVPGRPDDATSRAWGGPPDLRGLSPVHVAWEGPRPVPEQVGREAADIRAAEAGVPVLLYDTWAERWSLPNAPPRIPSRPRGRAPDLGRVLRGIVAVGGPGVDRILESAWGDPADVRDEWETVLLPLLPLQVSSPRQFLEESAARLRRAAEHSPGAVPWMAPLATHLGERALHLPEHLLAVPRVPASVVLDGRLDDPAWAFASVLTARPEAAGAEPAVRLLALADGRRLCLAVVARADSLPIRLEFWDLVGGLTEVQLTGEVPSDAPPPPVPPEDHQVASRRDGDMVTHEFGVGFSALGGDAYPTRVIDVRAESRGRPFFDGAFVLVP